MFNPTITDVQQLRDAGLPAFFRPQDAEAAGISYGRLRRMEAAGLVEREGWGLYWRADADITQHHSVAAVCARVPHAIVSLITALTVHDIGTQLGYGVWISVPHGNRAPTMDSVRLYLTRFSGPSLQYGVVEDGVRGRARENHDPGPHRGGLLPFQASRGPRGCSGGL